MSDDFVLKSSNRDRYQERKKKGLCVGCSNNVFKGVYCADCKAKRRDRTIKRMEKRRQDGICLRCTASAVNGRGLCKQHIDKVAAHRDEIISEGLCVYCGDQPIVPSLRSCENCTNKNNKQSSEYKKRLINQGKCPTCRNPTETGSSCLVCKAKVRGCFQTKQQQWKDAGLCQWCGTCPFNPAFMNKKTKYCDVCFFKFLSLNKNLKKGLTEAIHWTQLMELFNSQLRCPYSGLLLQVGSVSLDHRVPLSRGGSNTIDNLQFVYLGDQFDINSMKGDKMHDEFVSAIFLINDNLPPL